MRSTQYFTNRSWRPTAQVRVVKAFWRITCQRSRMVAQKGHLDLLQVSLFGVCVV